MDECKHSWWSCPNERFKSNPEKIIIVCGKCDAREYVKVVNHWQELELAMANDF